MTANNETNLLESYIAEGCWELVESAIKNGTNINALDEEGHTLLSFAVFLNKTEDVKKLIELGADVNVKLRINFNVLGYTALLFAQNLQGKNYSINPEIISLLINAGSDLNDAMLIGLRSGSVEFVDLLIKNGADINGKFAFNQSPLAITILGTKDKINPPILEYLAQNGADLNELFDFNNGALTTALNICISIERLDLMKILLDNGANPDTLDYSGRSSLVFAAITGIDYVNILLEHGANPNIPDQNGRTPLMLASMEGSADTAIIESLINAGTNLNAQDNSGLTALMWAVVSQDRTPSLIISALIRTGGLRAKDGEKWCGFAALYAAVRRECQLEIVRLLIEHGADVNILSKKGLNALTYAMMNFDDEIVMMLSNAGAKIVI